MPTQVNPADLGRERGQRLAANLRRELRDARRDRGLSQRDVGRAVRLSGAEISRLERGLVPLDLETAGALLAVVGLELAVRAFPAGQPLRDRAHAALLEALRRELHPSLSWRTEQPIPIPGDLRAWDAVIRGVGADGDAWIRPVECETGPRDLQALERRLELKMRDSDVDELVLLLADSRANRDLVRAHRTALAERFPTPGVRALELLRAGVPPPDSTLILLSPVRARSCRAVR